MNDNDKKRMEELEEIEKKYKSRNKYINDYQKNSYDRVTVLFQKGQKSEIEKTALKKGFKNISDYIKFLVENDKNQDEKPDGIQTKKNKQPEAVPEVNQQDLPPNLRLDDSLNYFN